jgi:hypothetical protein
MGRGKGSSGRGLGTASNSRSQSDAVSTVWDSNTRGDALAKPIELVVTDGSEHAHELKEYSAEELARIVEETLVLSDEDIERLQLDMQVLEELRVRRGSRDMLT